MLYHVYYEEAYGGTYLVEASSEEEAKEKVLDGLMEGYLVGPEICQGSAARILSADEIAGENDEYAYSQKSRYRLFLDMDGVLAQYLTLEEIGSIQRIYEPGYFKNLPVLTGMTHAVRMLRKEDPGVEVHVLSSVLPKNKNPKALSEKKLWLSRFFPVEESCQHFVPYQEGMSFKGRFAENRTDILIDDDIVNLEDWAENGGTGILMINEVRLKGWWPGQKLYYTPDPHIMLDRIRNAIENALA